MPVTTTYPGVYIEEIPSGVRTITGVSTSVAAFVGPAKFGSVNKAIRILSYADYERNFGGLTLDSKMSYAVRQFFLNGGSEAWVVRVAKNPTLAYRELVNSASTKVLKLSAKDAGSEGNRISAQVDHRTSNPASTFNLLFSYKSPGNSALDTNETFPNLSMNSKDARYVETIVNSESRLVKAERIVDGATVTTAGTSISGQLSNIDTLIDATHFQLRLSVNGSEPVDIVLDPNADTAGADDVARLQTLCNAIKTEADHAKASTPSFVGIDCVPENRKIKITSSQVGENSSIRALPGARYDTTRNLKLGTENGGVEEDSVATIRPIEIPDHGTLESGGLTESSFTATADNDIPVVPGPDARTFKINLDGGETVTVDVGDTALSGKNVDAKGAQIAERITNAVRQVRPNNPSYSNFTCTYDANSNKLKLLSGSRGHGSSVLVMMADSDVMAKRMKLLASEGASATPGVDTMLGGGSESPVTEANAYNVYIGNPSRREGIYALESVDLFNILCLPDVAQSGILMEADAYCRDRRAFMIIDAPRETKTPPDMVELMSGATLPKSRNAAVYYPWLRVADPLKDGRLDSFPPSGTIAGMYARIDSTRGVWKAPAGTEANLIGVQAVENILTDDENGTLNPIGVNCIRVFPVYGALSWGARTLRGADQLTDEYKYIPVRRLALFIEETLYRGTKWVVFEPNDEPLWAQIRLNIGAFMQNLFRQGAFQGKTPREAYFVKCDRETTIQNDIDRGIVNILVGFAPLKPAEFVIIKIQQIAGQVQA